MQSMYSISIAIVWFQKMSILPPQKGLEIPGDVGRGGGEGFSKAKNFKEMYEGGGGGSWRGYGYFLEPHISSSNSVQSGMNIKK